MRALVLTDEGQQLAGLSAALALAQDGHSVTVVRPAPRAAGAAEAGDGARFVLGWHGATHRLLARLGAADALRGLDALRFASPEGRVPSRMKLLPLPPPLDVLTSVAAFDALSFLERGLALRVAAAARFPSRSQPTLSDDETSDAWLRRLGQSDRARRLLWAPLAKLLVEQDLDAPALPLAAAIRETLAGSAQARLSLLDEGGCDPLIARAIERLVEAGATIVDGPATALTIERRGDVHLVLGAELAGGGKITSDLVIAALAPHAVAALVPSAVRAAEPYFEALAALTPASRVVVRLLLAGPAPTSIGSAPLGTPSTSFDWMQVRALGAAEHALTLTSVAFPSTDRRADRLLVEEAVAVMRRLDPRTISTRLIAAHVRRDDVSLTLRAADERRRPRARTPVEGLFLVGAGVRTGQSATLEGALRSAEEAAALAASWEAPPPPPRPQGFVPAGSLVRHKATVGSS